MVTITTAARSGAAKLLMLGPGEEAEFVLHKRAPQPGELWYVNNIITGLNVRDGNGEPPKKAKAFSIRKAPPVER